MPAGLRTLRRRANITRSLSHPAAARRSDDTALPPRAEMGLACPRCGRPFDEESRLIHCPDDGTPLVRAADLAAAAGDPMLGRVLASRFTILARLGAGSMGTVYRAKQSPIGREVAIKILRSDRAIDEVSRARFLREARANSLLTSPNTVTVFDFGQSENGDFYLAMELLEGESLGQRLKRVGRIPVDDAIETARQALRSLSEAHTKGIIHRDLKPDNLFYARVENNEKHEEIVKILDFGIAKMLHADGELAMNAIETQAGTVFGTPRYMSPEQAQGKPLDARSDLYSLGVILYHMLTGRPPFTDDDAIVVMARHIKTVPRPMGEVAPDARIPPDVESVVMRVLAKEPEKRPDRAEAFASELARVRASAAGTSGVRATLESGHEVLVGKAASIPPSPETADALASETLSAPAETARTSRRWAVPVAAAVVLALVALGVAVLGPRGRPTAPSSPPLAAPAAPIPTSVDLPAGPSTSPAPGVAEAATTAAPPAVSPGTAPRTDLRPRPARASVTPKAAGSASVGYGYLE